jgi:hypothetical protein
MLVARPSPANRKVRTNELIVEPERLVRRALGSMIAGGRELLATSI